MSTSCLERSRVRIAFSYASFVFSKESTALLYWSCKDSSWERVEAIHVKVNQSVAEDQLLLTIENTSQKRQMELSRIQLKINENNVKVSENSIKVNENSIKDMAVSYTHLTLPTIYSV